jgi:hypothetical protein
MTQQPEATVIGLEAMGQLCTCGIAWQPTARSDEGVGSDQQNGGGQ